MGHTCGTRSRRAVDDRLPLDGGGDILTQDEDDEDGEDLDDLDDLDDDDGGLDDDEDADESELPPGWSD